MTLQNLRKQLYTGLKEAFLENPLLHPQVDALQLDVDLILSHFLKKDRTWIVFNRDFEPDEKTMNQVYEAVEKRKTGLPVAYITGHREFFGIDFEVTPAVLIPKPDTELLVEKGISFLKEKTGALQEGKADFSVCDMCSGSGCAGISVIRGVFENGCSGNFHITFADISEDAMAVTRKNAERLLLKEEPFSSSVKVDFVLSDLFEKVSGTFDLIVTNPPYVPLDVSRELLKDGRNEPLLALNGDVLPEGGFSDSRDGLCLIRRLVPGCFQYLKPGGMCFMETGEYNAPETAELFKKAGFRNVCVEKDMNGMLRVVSGRKAGSL